MCLHRNISEKKTVVYTAVMLSQIWTGVTNIVVLVESLLFQQLGWNWLASNFYHISTGAILLHVLFVKFSS